MSGRDRTARLDTLLIVSHVVHYRHEGRLCAYGPYAREIDRWADLFPRVVIASPCREARPPGDCVAFSRSNITIAPQVEAGGDTLAAKLGLIARVPALVWGLARAMRRADAIHVRCPGNLGLLGALLAPLYSRRLVAKYAGQWNGYDGEPLTVRLQRAVLRSRWWRGPVTVYGMWPDQPAHVVPFFTSMMTGEQVAHAVRVGADKTGSHDPLRVLFSGRLERVKRADALLEAARLAIDAGVLLEVVILGDGPAREALRATAVRLGLDGLVTFAGAEPFDRGLRWYEWADCLVLPSQHSEGWPKVLAEAMCHGVLAIAVDHGQVRAMLADRGILLPTGTPDEIAAALRDAARDPARCARLACNGLAWARQYSLDGLRDAIRDLLVRAWGPAWTPPPRLAPRASSAKSIG